MNSNGNGTVISGLSETAQFVEDLSGGAEAGISSLLDRCSEQGASDLFLAMNENDAVVSMRHLGMMRVIGTLTAVDGRRWIAHVKALAGIPLDNKFKPKEGRWLRVHADGRKTDLRVNSIPTLFGEDLAIRLLERDGNLQQLEQLGMMHHELQTLRAMLESPGGLILVTGPTSSGKTTTLYACLHHLNNGERKINTIEDPIEYAVEGIRQTQINLHWDCDFPEMLRSVLRQAPDVIMIGEIRDPITAQTAVRAANSGHLVLATLHSGTACGAIQSMLNLGVHPHFFSNSLRGVVAQRLTRILCDQCRVDFDLSESPMTFDEIGHLLHNGEGHKLYTSVGCEACAREGYRSRTGVFEVLNVSPTLRKMMNTGAGSAELEAQGIRDGMLEFRRAGLLKVAKGVTNMEEILRVIPSENLGLC